MTWGFSDVFDTVGVRKPLVKGGTENASTCDRPP